MLSAGEQGLDWSALDAKGATVSIFLLFHKHSVPVWSRLKMLAAGPTAVQATSWLLAAIISQCECLKKSLVTRRVSRR